MSKDFATAFYHSVAWRRVRDVVLARSDGLCERCLREGRYELAYIVHHKVPLTPENIGDPSVTLNAELLEALCKECHERTHEEIGTGALNGRVEESPRVGFDAMGNVVRLER